MSEANIPELIIGEYESVLPLYREFTDQVEKLVSDLIKVTGFQCHSISSRLKNRESLRHKIDKSEWTFSSLDDITDICGIRIITYFADEVDRVAEIIEREFEIDYDNSVDKRSAMDPDRFGYLSLHFVARIDARRLALPEYKRFSECKCEIQIRSILQHTWAEIEHDLGYKTKMSIPREIQRRFSSLAGLLEIADNEFKQIRDELQRYEREIPNKIAERPSAVTIDDLSLRAYVDDSDIVKELDARIAELRGFTIDADKKLRGKRVQELNHLGLETIDRLEKALKGNKDIVVDFAARWLRGRAKRGSFGRGICIFYLCYVLLSQRGIKKDIRDYFEKFIKGSRFANSDEAAEALLDNYREVSEKHSP